MISNRTIMTRKHFNFDVNVHGTYVDPDEISETIPDQSLTVKEILERHTRGQETVSYNVVYDTDLEKGYPDISKMSTIEKAELALNYSDSVKDMAEQHKVNNIKRKADLQAKAAKAEAVKEATTLGSEQSDELQKASKKA